MIRPIITGEGYTACSLDLPSQGLCPSNPAPPPPYPSSQSKTYSYTLIDKEQEDVDGKMYEPPGEPVGTARSKIEHRRSGESNRVKGNPRISLSIFVNCTRFDCDARWQITWC